MSIGSKFAFWTLVLPICLILVVLAIAYIVYPNPFLLALVAALPSATVFIWRELRSTLREKMLQVWDSYLKPVRDTVSGAVIGSSYTFQGRREDLEATINWVEKRGKYGPFKLYPAKLFKQKLVSNYLAVAEDFNPKLNQLLESAKAERMEVHPYFGFDRWGLRKIPPDQVKGLDANLVVAQKKVLDYLGITKNEEIASLIEPWKRGMSLSKQIVSILNKFSSENGIMPPKVGNPFNYTIP